MRRSRPIINEPRSTIRSAWSNGDDTRRVVRLLLRLRDRARTRESSHAIRIACLLVAVGCLFVVGLTVSRGALVGIALATAVAVLRSLRKSPMPVVVLAGCIAVVVASGLFSRAIDYYGARTSEETGRLLTWPVVIGEFLTAPLTGKGVSNVAVFVATKDDIVTPHNGFLFLALTSEIVPLVFFIRYWWMAGKGALAAARAPTFEFPSFAALFVCAAYDFAYKPGIQYDWVVVALSIGLAAAPAMATPRVQRAPAFRSGSRLVSVAAARRPGAVPFH